MLILPAAAALSPLRFRRQQESLARAPDAPALLRCGYVHIVDTDTGKPVDARLASLLQPAATPLFCGLALADDEIDYLVQQLPGTGAQPHGRRTDDVRAGQLRALPAQDLQRRLDIDGEVQARSAVRHDPQHHGAAPRGRAVGLQGQRRGDRGHPAAASCRTGWASTASRRARPPPDEGRDPQPSHGHRPGPGRGHRRPAARSATRAPPVAAPSPRPACAASACRTCASRGSSSPGRGTRRPGGSSRRWTSCSRGRSAPPPSTTSSAARTWRLLPHLRAAACRTGPTASELRGYHKPIMIAGGVGNIAAEHVEKAAFPAGTPLVVLGGPAMLIGLGGGAASSMASGAGRRTWTSPPCSAPTRRCSGAARRSSTAAGQRGEDNPILFIHDVGAGGLSNALPELVKDGGCGGRFELRAMPQRDDPGMSPMEIWCNEARSAMCWPSTGDRLDEFEAICARERCPYAVVGEATASRAAALEDPFGERPDRHAHGPLLFGKPPRCSATTPAAADGFRPLPALTWPTPWSACCVARRSRTRVPDHHRRSQRHRAGRPRPDGRALAGAGGGLCRDPGRLRRLTGEAMAMGERTPVALLDAPPPGAWPSPRRSPTSPPPTSRDSAISSCPPTGWPPPAIPARTRRSTTRCARWAWSCARRSASPSRGQGLDVHEDASGSDGEGEQAVTAPLSLIVSAFAPVGRCPPA
jgi:hypothetical protein